MLALSPRALLSLVALHVLIVHAQVDLAPKAERSFRCPPKLDALLCDVQRLFDGQRAPRSPKAVPPIYSVPVRPPGQQPLERGGNRTAVIGFINSVVGSLLTENSIYVDISTARDADMFGIMRRLRGLGMVRLTSYRHMIGGFLPYEGIEDARLIEGIKLISATQKEREQMRPMASEYETYKHGKTGASPMQLENVGRGAATSQAIFVHNMDQLLESFDIDQSGFSCVGVLADSFDFVEGKGVREAGEIPDDAFEGEMLVQGVINLRDGEPFGSRDASTLNDEGSGMIELIADLLPEMPLYAFHTAVLGQADFANGILRLRREAGCNTLVDDVKYFFEPWYQDGIIAQAIEEVTEDGALYFVSAGNSGNSGLEGSYSRTDVPTNINNFLLANFDIQYEGAHDWNEGSDEPLQDTDCPGQEDGETACPFFRIALPPSRSLRVVLHWAQTYASASAESPGATSDFAVLIFDRDGIDEGKPLVFSDTSNIAGDPAEAAVWTNDKDEMVEVFVMVARFPTGDEFNGGRFNIITRGWALSDYTGGLVDETFGGPTSWGHALAPNAVPVAAADYRETPRFGSIPALPQAYVGGEGLAILFNPEGVRLPSPDTRSGRRVTAADGCNTLAFPLRCPEEGSCRDDAEGDGFPNFFGTSAAAPNAAAIAHLLKEVFTDRSNGDILQALFDTARRMPTWFSRQGSIPPTSGYSIQTGHGLINALLAFELLVSQEPIEIPPEAPSEGPPETPPEAPEDPGDGDEDRSSTTPTPTEGEPPGDDGDTDTSTTPLPTSTTPLPTSTTPLPTEGIDEIPECFAVVQGPEGRYAIGDLYPELRGERIEGCAFLDEAAPQAGKFLHQLRTAVSVKCEKNKDIVYKCFSRGMAHSFEVTFDVAIRKSRKREMEDAGGGDAVALWETKEKRCALEIIC
ncbi:unnamed protein product [Vitrella brassicaformis CCMP3155]|uniref:subtilisin n=1 Tax=Vitrella brassicaformis (strain CCMP3155) TaxID=1169540 RepID=A0A0G4H2S9_VITBC|nr:unnamed protein product [Vitrella brassicaformis CCMP3155]|eukprot:CEM37969.1 unnamed protein product [Vitrella brassicaformis CCMP3155]